MRRFAIYLVLAVARGRAADSTRIVIDLVHQDVVQKRLEAVPLKTAERRPNLEELFREAGCVSENLVEQPVKSVKEPNVVCTLPGETDAEIVVGGHYDRVDAGRGAIDDWSGVALLPSLYESLKTRPRHHRFVFVGFSAEERGLVGSTAYVKAMNKERRKSVTAMINLECLGLGPPSVWQSRADKKLLDAYMRLATAMGIPLRGVNVERVGDDDSHPFLEAHIPVLTIHSLTSQNFALLHTARDDLKEIHPTDYYTAYRLAANLLAYLDLRE